MNLDNPSDLPGNLYQNISQVETLLETLNWINRESHRRDLLAQVVLIAHELEQIIQKLQERESVSKISIAKIQIVRSNLNRFKIEVMMRLSDHLERAKIKEVQMELNNNFKIFKKTLISTLFDVKSEIEKMRLSYN